MKSVVIITPTIGSPELKTCVQSVMDQDYKGKIRHLVVIDGPEYCQSVYDHLPIRFRDDDLVLPTNVGKDGWYGHRVYASVPYLVDEDIVMFLDQDNWLRPYHVSSMIATINEGNQWAYCYRSIYDKDGNFICVDDCESLGETKTWCSTKENPQYHIDTSCFAVPREILVKGICGAWYGKWGADRQFFGILKQYYPKFCCTHEYTLNYRLSGNPNSVTKEFFLEGNKAV